MSAPDDGRTPQSRAAGPGGSRPRTEPSRLARRQISGPVWCRGRAFEFSRSSRQPNALAAAGTLLPWSARAAVRVNVLSIASICSGRVGRHSVSIGSYDRGVFNVEIEHTAVLRLALTAHYTRACDADAV